MMIAMLRCGNNNEFLSAGPALRVVVALLAMTLSASAQDPLKTLPKNYKLVFENEDVAVIKAHYGAHEKIPIHDHPSVSTVFVYLSDSGPVRIDHEDPAGKVVPGTRPPTTAGAYRIAPGIAERHSIENLGDTASDFLRVELKHVTLTMKEPFRGKAPAELGIGSDVVEFDNRALQVERIICVGFKPCAIKATDAPSLLVIFSPVSLAANWAHKEDHPAAGSVRWLPASHDEMMLSDCAVGAQVLRILLPPAAK